MRTINKCLYQHMKTVKYVRFLDVVRLVANAGIGAWIFLIDAQDAYHRVPIHSDDWKYMGLNGAISIGYLGAYRLVCLVHHVFMPHSQTQQNMYVSNITWI